MRKIIETSLKKYFQLRKFRITFWQKSQCESQELILQELLSSGSETVFGKEHSFDQISTVEDYKKLVPVRTYEELFPMIERMLEGEKSVLWPGKVSMFSKSSGTTNDTSKYIPVTRESLQNNNYTAGKDLYAFIFMQHPELEIFKDKGSVLSVTGSFDSNNEGMKIGDVSAIMASELPSIFQNRRLPSLKTALMPHWETKMPAIINETLDENITHLLGVPTWFVALFEKMKETNPYKNLREIWPNLQLFIHGAVAFEPYREIFKKLIPFEDMCYVEVYNSSEGFFAVQDEKERPGEMLLLTDHGVFYEFIPFDKYQQGSTEALSLSEVSAGVDYAMIISTNAGLWRYDLGDLVQFTSIDPFRIKITGRTKAFINICGEELMVGNTDRAISETAREFSVQVEHYTVAPIFINQEGKAGHQWLVEFSDAQPSSFKEFTRVLDAKLQEINSDYKAKRQGNIVMQELQLDVVPKGNFIQWLKQKGKLGGQYKVPKLSQDRKVIESILNKKNTH